METYTVTSSQLRYDLPFLRGMVKDKLEFLSRYKDTCLRVETEDGPEVMIQWDGKEYQITLDAVTRTKTVRYESAFNAADAALRLLESEV